MLYCAPRERILPDFWKYISAALAVGGLLLGVGRFVGQIEQRISTLERAQQFSHGDLTPFLKKE